MKSGIDYLWIEKIVITNNRRILLIIQTTIFLQVKLSHIQDCLHTFQVLDLFLYHKLGLSQAGQTV